MRLNKDISFYDKWHEQALRGENKLKTEERQGLLRQIMKGTNDPILVVGCGGASEMTVLPKEAHGIGIDISYVALQKSKNRHPQYSFVLADASQLPFRRKSFETLVCSEVIEHVRNPDDALQEFSRVLVERGSLILTTPNWLSFYGLARLLARLLLRRDFTSGDQPYDRWTTRRLLDKRLRAAGFHSRRSFGLWFFPPFGKGKHRISDSIIVPILRKAMFAERLLRPYLASFGHVLVIDAEKAE